MFGIHKKAQCFAVRITIDQKVSTCADTSQVLLQRVCAHVGHQTVSFCTKPNIFLSPLLWIIYLTTFEKVLRANTQKHRRKGKYVS